MDKCSYADKYKAIRPPKCGCDTCRKKWKEAEERRKAFWWVNYNPKDI